MTDGMDQVVEVPMRLVLELLNVLRVTHVYALKDSHPEELGEDFKPWKWDGFEKLHAHEATGLHLRLLDLAKKQQEAAMSHEHL